MFDPKKPCVFAKDRPLFNGEARKAGEPVPPGFSDYQLKSFHRAGIIKNSGVVTEPVVTEPVVTEPVVTEPVVTEPVVTEPVVTEPVVTEPTATPARLAAVSAGWYNVEVDGLGPVNPAKLKGKAAAEKWATENNYLIVVDSEPTGV